MRKAIIFIVILLSVAAVFLYRYTRYRPEEEVEQLAKIAIVIDDFGYSLKNLDTLFGLEVPVTISILPNLPYSGKIAEKAARHNYEVILHLPLEPREDNKPLEEATIFCSMQEEEILRELERAIGSVPNLAGISNHMGSKATADERLMTIIFQRMKKSGLFFLDNLVIPDSVCEKIAGRIGIRFVRRSVFLDNESSADYIKSQINQLKYQALKTGWAVGVGHDRSPTLSAIKEMIPQLEKDGIKFVFLSELAK